MQVNVKSKLHSVFPEIFQVQHENMALMSNSSSGEKDQSSHTLTREPDLLNFSLILSDAFVVVFFFFFFFTFLHN